MAGMIVTMASTGVEVIEIGDSDSSPDENATPLRPIFCLKNRDQLRKIEEEEECFIIEFDPYDEISISKVCLPGNVDGTETTDLWVVAEKGQVACRDYPHPRHTCAEYPFLKTPHDRCCKRCYCYVCDLVAPCKDWTGYSGHCHAFNNEAWSNQRKKQRELVKA